MQKLNEKVSHYVKAVKRQPLDYVSDRFPMEVIDVLPYEIAKNEFLNTVSRWVDSIYESLENYHYENKEYSSGFANIALVEIERDHGKDLQLMLYLEDLGDCTLPCKYRRALLPLATYNENVEDSLVDPNGLILRNYDTKLAERKRFNGYVAQNSPDYPTQPVYYTVLAALPHSITVQYEHKTGHVNIHADDYWEWHDAQEPCVDSAIEELFTYVATDGNSHKIRLTVKPANGSEQAWLSATCAEDLLETSLTIEAELIDTGEFYNGPKHNLFTEFFVYNENGSYDFDCRNADEIKPGDWLPVALNLKFSSFTDAEKIHMLYMVLRHSFAGSILWKQTMSKTFTLRSYKNGDRYIGRPFG